MSIISVKPSSRRKFRHAVRPSSCAGATETGGFVRRDIVALRYGTEYRRETVWRYEVRQWHRMNSHSMSRRGISSIRPRYRVLRNDYLRLSFCEKTFGSGRNATILSGVAHRRERRRDGRSGCDQKCSRARDRGRRSCPGNSDDLEPERGRCPVCRRRNGMRNRLRAAMRRPCGVCHLGRRSGLAEFGSSHSTNT